MKKQGKYHHGDLKNALIEAGIDILAREGVSGLSLRQVASRAGVSHAAPYAHFADKQALIAAISTQGYSQLYDRLSAAVRQNEGDPLRQLVETAWAYIEFALTDTAHFRITFSGMVEREQDYPAFVEISHKNLSLVKDIVEACQRQSILPEGPVDLVAISVWSLIHGLVSLALEGQVPHTVLDRLGLKRMLIFSLNLIARVKIDPDQFPIQEKEKE